MPTGPEAQIDLTKIDKSAIKLPPGAEKEIDDLLSLDGMQMGQ